MSETTELKRDKLSEWFRQQIEPLLDHEYERGKADAQPTPPASEPSEQPKEQPEDAEAHFMKYLRGLIIAAWKNGHGLWNSSEDFAYTHYDYDVLPVLKKLVSQYARRASARAVEAERQRLARLLVEEHRAIDELLKSTVLSKSELDCVPTKRAALQKFKSWLAGEGENA